MIWLFAVILGLSFVIPGGLLTVLFFALIGTPIWLALWLLWTYIKAYWKLH